MLTTFSNLEYSEWLRQRERERDWERERERQNEWVIERERERERDWDREGERERGRERERDWDREGEREREGKNTPWGKKQLEREMLRHRGRRKQWDKERKKEREREQIGLHQIYYWCLWSLACLCSAVPAIQSVLFSIPWWGSGSLDPPCLAGPLPLGHGVWRREER